MKNLFKKIFSIAAILLLIFSYAQAVTILPVPQGGTGVGTITGILQGTGTAALSPITIGSGLTFTSGTLAATSGGGGTVTSFSAGNLSPLFTSSVATATTTPALTFGLSTHNANTIFAGPTTGSAAAPTFRSLVLADLPAIAVSPITIQNTTSLFSTGLTGTGSLSTATNGVFLGQNAGFHATNANASIFLGNGAGSGATNASSAFFAGPSAGDGATSAESAVFIGDGAGSGASGGAFSVFLGPSAGNGATSATSSNFIGNSAGLDATNAENSNFFGINAGRQATDAVNSNFFGDSAGNGAIGAQNSNFFGPNSGVDATNAQNSNFFGPFTGNGATNAANSTFIGNGAGSGAEFASNSIFIGSDAGESDAVDNTGSGDDFSILLGPTTSTGGFKNSIAIGGSATNTAQNQFMLGSSTRPINEFVLNGSHKFLEKFDGTDTFQFTPVTPTDSVMFSGDILSFNSQSQMQFNNAGVGSGMTFDGSGGISLNSASNSAVSLTSNPSGNNLSIGSSGINGTTVGNPLIFQDSTNGGVLEINNASVNLSTGVNGTMTQTSITDFTQHFGQNTGQFSINNDLYTDFALKSQTDGTLVLQGLNGNGVQVTNLAGSGTRAVTADSSGLLSASSTVPTIGATNFTTGNTTALGNVAQYIPSADSTLIIYGLIDPTAIVTNAISLTVSYVDVHGSSVTQTLPLTLASTGAVGTTATVVGRYSSLGIQIRAEGGAAVTIGTTVTGIGSQTYDVGGTIEFISN